MDSSHTSINTELTSIQPPPHLGDIMYAGYIWLFQTLDFKEWWNICSQYNMFTELEFYNDIPYFMNSTWYGEIKKYVRDVEIFLDMPVIWTVFKNFVSPKQ